METWAWIGQNWFELATVVSFIATLICWLISQRLNRQAAREETAVTRVANLLILTSNHHELIKPFYLDAPLDRVFDAAPDISSEPISVGEEMYMNAMIQHLFSAYYTMQNDLTVKPEHLRRDIHDVFTSPIPKNVWVKLKAFQNDDFVAFVERSIAGKDQSLK